MPVIVCDMRSVEEGMWRTARNSPRKHMQNPGKIKPVLIRGERKPFQGRRAPTVVRDFWEPTERADVFVRNSQYPACNKVI